MGVRGPRWLRTLRQELLMGIRKMGGGNAIRAWTVGVCVLSATQAYAQIAVVPSLVQQPTAVISPPMRAEPAAPTAEPCCLIATGTPLYIQLVDELSSKTNLPGDTFRIKLSDPIKVDGRIVIPAGTGGRGEVIDAARAGMGGKPGELVLAARYLSLDGRQIPLRGFKLGGHRLSNSKEAQTAVLLFGVVGLAMRGGDMVLPVGAEASAKIARDITLPPSQGAGLQYEKTDTQ